MEVNGKVAVVSGAGLGIGRSIAKTLAQSGARVCVFERDPEAAAIVTHEINNVLPGAAIEVTGDASNLSDIERAIEITTLNFGAVDLYCANAGIATPGVAIDDGAWGTSFEVNLFAHVRAAKLLLPAWRARRSGYFLVTASGAGLTTQLGDVAYSVSKHAAIAFAEWLSITYFEEGIRVSCLCPMGVKTPMLNQLLDSDQFDYSAAIGRILTADQVANEVLEGLKTEKFLIAPQQEILDIFSRKGEDYERWLSGMRRLQSKIRKVEL